MNGNAFDQWLTRLRETGIDAFDDDRLAVAAELLERYLRYVPGDAYVWHVLGEALRLMRRTDEAEAALSTAYSLAPDEMKPCLAARLGLLFEDAGRRELADEWFSRSCSSDIESDENWMWIFRGTNLFALGRLAEAEQCLRRATQIERNLDEAYLNLAFVLRAQQRYREAIAAAEKCLEIDPDCGVARDLLHSMNGVLAVVDDEPMPDIRMVD